MHHFNSNLTRYMCHISTLIHINGIEYKYLDISSSLKNVIMMTLIIFVTMQVNRVEPRAATDRSSSRDARVAPVTR